MIVGVALSGWGSSSRPFHSRMAEIAAQALEPYEHVFLGKRAMFSNHRSRRFRKFIQEHNYDGNVLLCVGKSLGARNMVEEVLNPLEGPISYRKVFLLTVDPNWPESWDWTPNLNRHTLRLRVNVNRAINVYLIGKRRQQCGAQLAGPSWLDIENRGITDEAVTHQNISTHPEVWRALDELVKEASHNA